MNAAVNTGVDLIIEVLGIESFRLGMLRPERDIAIMKTLAGATVAMFGYFDPFDRWHFMIVPNEYRTAPVLAALRAELQQMHSAELRFASGDTIDWTPAKKRAFYQRLFGQQPQPVLH